MGGRGASSGTSNAGNPYGSQYHTIMEDGNIKFVAKNKRQSETLMETMTPGRIYVETGGNDLLRIVMFDENNKRNRVIERSKQTGEWHLHEGYFHTEYGNSPHDNLTPKDRELVDRITEKWYNRDENIV